MQQSDYIMCVGFTNNGQQHVLEVFKRTKVLSVIKCLDKL